MRKKIMFVLAVFAVTVVLMALQKPLFLAYYHVMAARASAAELWGVVWHGLALDCTVAGYITALPLLVVLASVWVPLSERIWRICLRIYFCLVAVAVGILLVANLGLYEYWGFCLDSQVLNYLASPEIAAASVTPLQAVLGTVAVLLEIALFVVPYLLITRLFSTSEKPSCGRKTLYTAVCIVLCGLTFVAIRGGFSTAVANVSKSYFSSYMFLNHAATNPVFSFMSSVAGSKDETSGYDFYSEKDCDRLFASVSGAGFADKNVQRVLRTTRPNVIVIITESFSRTITDTLVNGQPVQPNLLRYASEGIWFENLYANSFRTDRGTMALMSSFPAQPNMSLSKTPEKCRHLPALARVLDTLGYVSSYTYGGDAGFTNKAAYLYNSGYEQVRDYRTVHSKAPKSKWGYADDVMFDEFYNYVQQLNAAREPYLATLMTISSHEPFEVPYHRFESPLLNSMAFTDDCLGKFLDRLRTTPEWANTLVVIVADHAYPFPEGIEYNVPTRHHIPMVWTGGAVAAPLRVTDFCSQTDFAPTLLGQMDVKHTQFRFGRNIFDADTPKFGYFTFNNGFGVIDASGYVVWDCTEGKVLREFGASSAEKVDIGRAILQQTFRDIRRL